MLRAELIGRKIEVEQGKIKGIIIDETKNTFLIETVQGKKMVTKQGNTFLIEAPEGMARVVGKQLVSRPEERIKNW